MVQDKTQLLWSVGILSLIGVTLFFIATNVNPALGTIYNNLLFVSIAAILGDYFFGKQQIKLINSRVNWISAFVWGVAGYVALIVSTQLASTLSKVIPLTEVLALLGSSAPVFSNSATINFFTFGALIPYIETFALFVALPDLLATMFRTDLNKRTIFTTKVLAIIVSLSLLFLLLHVTAKGITNESVLILVFFMAFISLIITIWTEDARPAIILHIIANSIAASTIFSITPTINLISVFSFIGL